MSIIQTINPQKESTTVLLRFNHDPFPSVKLEDAEFIKDLSSDVAVIEANIPEGIIADDPSVKRCRYLINTSGLNYMIVITQPQKTGSEVPVNVIH